MKRSFAALLFALPVLAFATPAVRDVSADSLRLFRRGLSAFLTNRGTDYAETYLHLMVEDSTGAVLCSTGMNAEIPGLTSISLSYDIGGYEQATYVARCSVDYDEDENPSNDTASLHLLPPPEVGITAMPPFIGQGRIIQPFCWARNRSSTDPVDFFVFYRIDSTYSDSLFVEGLSAGKETVLVFHDEWHALLVGEHPTLCSLDYPFYFGWVETGFVFVVASGVSAESKPQHGPGPVRLVPEPGGFVLYGPPEALENVMVFDPAGRMLATTRRRESGRLCVSGLSPGVYIVSTEDFRHKLILAR